MIGDMTYEEMKKSAKELSSSSQIIRTIADKYESDLGSVLDFCNSIDSYSKFLETSVQLYQDSDEALQTMIQKNK
jgi:uncharacterized protein YukE